MEGQDAPGIVAPLLRDVRLLSAAETSQYGTIEPPRLVQDNDFPRAPWMRAWTDGRGRRFPNAIAHRGLNVTYPENSMAAFKGAVAVGAHALETDIHISKDNVLVLSHDADLKRCFGVNKKIVDCDWKYLRTLTSKRAPGEPPACLGELLEWLIQPDQDHLWLLLDIKMDNNPSKVMQLIARTIASVAPRTRSWSDRIVLGVWTAHFVPFCPQYLPGFPITHIGVSTKYAQQFFEVPNCSFNMLQTSLVAPLGSRFLRKVKAAQRELYAWTVNEQNMMKWCIQKELDGVITDNPQLFREVCHDWRDDEPPAKPTLIQWVMTFCVYFFSSILIFVASRKHPANMHEYMAEHQPGKSRTNKVS